MSSTWQVNAPDGTAYVVDPMAVYWLAQHLIGHRIDEIAKDLPLDTETSQYTAGYIDALQFISGVALEMIKPQQEEQTDDSHS